MNISQVAKKKKSKLLDLLNNESKYFPSTTSYKENKQNQSNKYENINEKLINEGKNNLNKRKNIFNISLNSYFASNKSDPNSYQNTKSSIEMTNKFYHRIKELSQKALKSKSQHIINSIRSSTKKFSHLTSSTARSLPLIKKINQPVDKQPEKQYSNLLNFPRKFSDDQTTELKRKSFILNQSKIKKIINLKDRKYSINKKISEKEKNFLKKAKENSKHFCDAIKEIGLYSPPYEVIYRKIALNKIAKNIYINRQNFDRFVKVIKVQQNEVDENEGVDNIAEIKKYIRESEYNAVRNNKFPKMIKLRGFTNSALNQFRQYDGNFFGFPV